MERDLLPSGGRRWPYGGPWPGFAAGAIIGLVTGAGRAWAPALGPRRWPSAAGSTAVRKIGQARSFAQRAARRVTRSTSRAVERRARASKAGSDAAASEARGATSHRSVARAVSHSGSSPSRAAVSGQGFRWCTSRYPSSTFMASHRAEPRGPAPPTASRNSSWRVRRCRRRSSSRPGRRRSGVRRHLSRSGGDHRVARLPLMGYALAHRCKGECKSADRVSIHDRPIRPGDPRCFVIDLHDQAMPARPRCFVGDGANAPGGRASSSSPW